MAVSQTSRRLNQQMFDAMPTAMPMFGVDEHVRERGGKKRRLLHGGVIVVDEVHGVGSRCRGTAPAQIGSSFASVYRDAAQAMSRE